MIDKLNIFPQIKKAILEIEPEAVCIAIGSRVSEKVKKDNSNKWDFDLILQNVSKKRYGVIKNHLINEFAGKVDEFSQQIKIDISIDYKNRFKNGIRL